jgi:pimeloyl-ACP methyl ester carboxylesterase
MEYLRTVPYAEINGLRMYHEIHGDGPPLLLLHGGSDVIPEAWIPHFAPPFRVIALEQMGHGRSGDRIDRPFHYHDMAEDTVAFVRGLGIGPAVVVGFSDGGIIGLDLAIHHPELVAALVVTGANARFDGYTPKNQEYSRTFDPATQPVPDEYARLSPDGAEHWPVFLGRLKAMWGTEPNITDDELQRIQAPTLLIVGDRDIVTPEHTVEMFRAIPDAQLCVMPNAGHGAMPFETVLAFLDGVRARTGHALD